MDTIEKALEAIAQGEFVIVTDDTERENEGDLILAAEMMIPEKMSFLLKHTSGVVCVALTAQKLDHLHGSVDIEITGKANDLPLGQAEITR